MTQILLYSNSAIGATGLAQTLEKSSDLELLPICNNLMDIAQAGEADLVLIDQDHDLDLGTVLAIRSSHRRAKMALWATVRIFPEFVWQATNLGVCGVVNKNDPVEKQLKCLQKIAAGQPYYKDEMLTRLRALRTISLCERSAEMAALVGRGLRNKEIAAVVGASEGVVKTYLSRLFKKYKIKDRQRLRITEVRNLTPGSLTLPEGTRLPILQTLMAPPT